MWKVIVNDCIVNFDEVESIIYHEDKKKDFAKIKIYFKSNGSLPGVTSGTKSDIRKIFNEISEFLNCQ